MNTTESDSPRTITAPCVLHFDAIGSKPDAEQVALVLELVNGALMDAGFNCQPQIARDAIPPTPLVITGNPSPSALLEQAREWAWGDLQAAQENEEGKTELDLATLHARVDTLGE